MRKANEKNNKGITLIALVITIIVMLILVAVTITMAVNGGLFDYAQKAVGETKNAIDKEQELGSGRVNIAGTGYNSIDEYVNLDDFLLGDGKVVLSDDYGHRYTVEEPGQYYFYSYTYGQNFMSVFDVTENDGKLKATKLGEYSNETGVSREESSASGWISEKGWTMGGTCLSDSSALANMAIGEDSGRVWISGFADHLFYSMSFYLVPGYYFYEKTGGDLCTWCVDLSGNSSYLGEVEALSSDKNWVDLNELAFHNGLR